MLKLEISFALIIKSSLALIFAPILSTEFLAVIFTKFPCIFALFAPSKDLFIKLSVVIEILSANKFPVFCILLAFIAKSWPASIESFLFFNLFKVSFVKYTLGIKTFWPLIFSSTYHIILLFN